MVGPYMTPVCLSVSPVIIALQNLSHFYISCPDWTPFFYFILISSSCFYFSTLFFIPRWSFLSISTLLSFFFLRLRLCILPLLVFLCCRPVWISGNRSAFGECRQEWLSSNWRYDSSEAFFINHDQLRRCVKLVFLPGLCAPLHKVLCRPFHLLWNIHFSSGRSVLIKFACRAAV